MITIKTNHGDISVELFDEQAPVSCETFRQYIRDGHYAGTIFHRVIPNFMIQGGGMDESMTAKPTRDPIKNEADNGLKNDLGTIAMARTPDPHSASSQFFINAKDNDFLNYTAASMQGWGYCVFGRVSEGMDVVNKMKGVDTTSTRGHQDVPAEDLVIEQAILDE